MQDVPSTRDRLIRILRVDGPQTASQLSEALGIGSTAVRQHLDRLFAEGWVEVVGLSRGIGRPGQLFGLTKQADEFFVHHYDHLALELLEAIESLPEGDQLLRRVLKTRRERRNARYAPRLAQASLADRLQIVTDILNQEGHIAEIEPQADGTYLLIEHHCPIFRVAQRYPLFCQQDRIWLREALQAKVETIQRRAAGEAQCTFRIVP